MNFEIIDIKTNAYPNVEKIILEEEWAKNLIYCDIEGFALTEDGNLVLMDECGNFVYCPNNRFYITIRFNNIPSLEKQSFSYLY